MLGEVSSKKGEETLWLWKKSTSNNNPKLAQIVAQVEIREIEKLLVARWLVRVFARYARYRIRQAKSVSIQTVLSRLVSRVVYICSAFF